jgi:nesprin-1
VDGRPPVILGLIWTIILYFQIEENTKHIGDYQSQSASFGSDSRRRSSGWKVGARNALLQWCKEVITPKFGIHVDNFGASWRDGRAFVALISALNPDLFVKLEDFEGLLTLHALQGKSNQSRLKIAFLIAEKEFGIYPLLDPEDVDVSNPDEKSIMTYVAQFLNKFSSKETKITRSTTLEHQETSEKKNDRCASVAYTSSKLVQPLPKRPSSSKSHQSNLPLSSKIEQLRAWLTTTNQFFESINLKKEQRRLSYVDYQQFKKELEAQQTLYAHLKSQHEIQDMKQDSLWKDIDTNWQRVETQLRHLQWILDTALPGELGIIGEWVNQGEAFLTSDDEPVQFNEDSAALLNQKIDDHKQFFENYERTMEQLRQWTSKAGPDVPSEQLQSLVKRLHLIGPKACKRGFHLKFLEHKCCILAFLNLTENKLRLWTRKCGPEDNVLHVLNQYKAFVSKNKIFQEFHKAFLEFKDVSEDYKNNANIAVHERTEIDKFIEDVSQKWSAISTELQHVQAHLNEVLSNWQQWNSSYAAMENYLNEAFDRFEGDEAQIQHFLEDLDQWKMHYSMLQTTSSFLMSACDENIASNLQQKMAVIHCNWSYLLQYAEKYGSDTLNRATFDDNLSNWKHGLLKPIIL